MQFVSIEGVTPSVRAKSERSIPVPFPPTPITPIRIRSPEPITRAAERLVREGFSEAAAAEPAMAPPTNVRRVGSFDMERFYRKPVGS